MKEQPTITRIDPTETDRIMQLLLLVFQPEDVEAPAEFWRWKHVDNPFGPSPCLVAEADGQIVGLRAFMRWRWTTSTASYSAVRAVDTVTHPSWRGQGIFTRLTRQLIAEMEGEGVAFVFNTPNEKSRPGYLKMGWRPVGRIPLMVKPCSLGGVLGVGKRDGLSPPEGEFHDIGEISRVGPEGHSAGSSTAGGCRLYTSKTPEFLHWRYASCPVVNYGSVTASDGDNHATVIYRYRNRRGRREVSLSEVLVGETESSVRMLPRLIRETVRRTGADYVVACAASRTRERRALFRTGFLPPLPIGPIFTARPLAGASDMPDLFDWRSWHCSIGDLELF